MATGDGVVNTGGIELHLSDSDGNLVKVTGLKRCNHPALTAEEAQTTAQGAGGQRTHKPGMADNGPLSAVVGYEPGSATDTLISEHLASRRIRDFKLVQIAEDGTAIEYSGRHFLTGYTPDDGQLGGERTATLTSRPSGRLTAVTQSIALSASSVAENALSGSTVGVLSVTGGSGSYTFAIATGGDPDGKFAIAGSNLNLADTLDFETATSHQVTIEADNGVDTPLSATFTINVTNVFEAATLSALSVPGTVTQGTTVSITGATAGSSIAGTMPTGWTLDGPNREITIAGDAPTGSQNWSLVEALADSANSPRTSTGSSTVEEEASAPVALPAYTSSPSTSAFGDSAIAWPRMLWETSGVEQGGLELGVTESGDGVRRYADNPDASNPRGRLIECSTAGGSGHAFHAERIVALDHDSQLEAGNLTDPAITDTSMATVYWQTEFVPVEGEAKFWAAYADGSQATELFYFGIADAGEGNFRFVTNGTVGSRNHAYGEMVKARLSRTAAGAITLESNSGSGWLSEGSLTGQTTTAITSFRWGCFGATKASDFRFSATAISDTGFAEMDRDFYFLCSGTRAINTTGAKPVLYIPDGAFAGQTQARVRWAPGDDPTGGTATAWVPLTSRVLDTLALPITGQSANTRYSYQFEIGNSLDEVVAISEPFKFRTLQTLGQAAASQFMVESCHLQTAYAHPYRDTQHTLDNIDENYLGSVHLGDIGYEAGATANISRYMRGFPPTTEQAFGRMLVDYFADYDMERLQRAGPYIVKADDHQAINNITLDQRGSSQLGNDFQGNKTTGDGWGTTTVGELWTAGLAVQDAWFYRHQYDLPSDESNGEPARYWKLGHGEVEFIFIDSRWTQSPSNNRMVSVQQDTWIKAQIDALKSTTKLVFFVTQVSMSFFTQKPFGNAWEDVATAQYRSLIDYIAANLPAGCKAMLLCGDDHQGYIFHDDVVTPTNATTPDNIIGELIASAGANGYRLATLRKPASARWRYDPANLTDASEPTYIKGSGVLIDINAASTQIDFSAQVGGAASSYTALQPPSLNELSGSFTLTEGAAQGTAAGTISGTTAGSTLSLVDDAGGRVQLDGNVVEAGATATDFATATSHSFTVRETLAEASNSPRDTVFTLNVVEASAGYTFINSEAEAYVNAMTVEPNDQRKSRIDDLIGALKTAGVYAKLDALYVMAAHDAQAARLNAIAPASNTLTGSLTFTTDRGFTGNGTTALDTNFAANSGTNFTETNCSMWCWVNADGADNRTMGVASAPTLGINARNPSGDANARMNADAVSAAVADRSGLTLAGRNGGFAALYRDDTQIANASGVSGNTIPTDNILILGGNGTFATDRAAAAAWGAFLSSTEVEDLHAALNTYLTAIGGA